MQNARGSKRLYLIIGLPLLLVAAVFLLISLRTARQNQTGNSASPTPAYTSSTSPVYSASPTPGASAIATPTPVPTPYVDPATIQGGDRGLLVASLQTRLHRLGYFSYKSTGYFSGMTQTAVRAFQQRHNLIVDAVASKDTLGMLFSTNALRATATPAPLPGPTPPTVRPRDYGQPLSFSQASALIPTGKQFLVVDLNSQLYFNATRIGGARHMEIAPLAGEDVNLYLAIFSGRSPLAKRPCVVEYEGQIIAASLCGYSHVEKPGAPATLCLYFFGSTAQDSQLIDVEHEANLLLASNGVLPE